MKKTTMYWPEDLDAAIQATARREGRSSAAVVRDAVVEYLARRPRELPSFVASAEGSLPRGVHSGKAKPWIRERWDREYDKRQTRADA